MSNEDYENNNDDKFQAAEINSGCILIDNSCHLYHPVRLRCGVTLMCRPEVLVCCPMIMEYLNSDVSKCLQILPVSVRSLVRRTRIWVNLTYCYGRCDQPEYVNHTTAHHHEAWLLW
jgi:hypothetical protein